ncbi:site-specific DNA-methyltransferase [Paenalcaligenes faecalis]|uniref:site-specific DNA-methyltransferase n=1 Tax=Paenalcaligenes faecalis TaxID=2980099 RepID=UPI0022B95D6B|nr:site-specific DNA-methyltransferase [Paenalcaligenes faecalis]
MHSPDLTQQNLEKIRAAFPNCVTEARDAQGNLKLAIDFDLLKQELADSIVEGPQERYRLDWPGKREAMLTANAPIAKTLRPARDESVDFDETENLFIEGDNLEALKLLQESYLGKVKMIYIDPPYNTGKDFVYEDDFAESTKEFLSRSNQIDIEGNRLVANPESKGRFHSDWLSMMLPRLRLAKSLLAFDGIICISIDDSELKNLYKICDEVFGEKNFIACMYWQSKSGGGHDEKTIVKENEYILVYTQEKDRTVFGRRQIKNDSYKNEDEHCSIRGKYSLNKLDRMMRSNHYSEALNYSIDAPDGSLIWPGGEKEKSSDWNWRWSQEKFRWGIDNDFIVIRRAQNGQWAVYSKQYEFMDHTGKLVERNYPYRSLIKSSDFNTTSGGSQIRNLFDRNVFEYSKPVGLLNHIIKVSGAVGNDVVLDFFSGSSTAAHAVMQLNAEDGGNRKFIMIQLPEVTDEKSEAYKAGYKTIAEISKERIRRAGKQILEGECHEDWNKDVGFRVLKVDTSNMKDVYYNPNEISQADLLDSVDHIKPDRSSEDLLFQVLLDWGVDLTLPIRRETIHGKEVFIVDENALVACFDDNITEELVNELADLQPLRVIFRDTGFSSDSIKINATQTFKQRSPMTEVKSI